MDTVIILAGGLGTRLKSVLPDIPKCLAPINNKPFVGLLINNLKNQGVKNFIFALGYKSEVVIKYLDSHFEDTNIYYSVENEQLGTGGAIKQALSLVDSVDFLVVNGDTFYNNDLNLFYKFHRLSGSSFSIALTTVEKNTRFGTVVLNNDKEIVSFSEKDQNASGLINAGHYIINKIDFLNYKFDDKFSLEVDFFQKDTLKKKFYGFEYISDFIDIGIPEDLDRAQSIFRNY